MLIVCLANMPYGYYCLTRFFAMTIFACLAYISYNDNKKLFVIFSASALLFQPFVKITLGRTIWNIVDVIEALFLLWFWITKYNKQKTTMTKRKTSTGIPGLSFSWKRALGITQAKQKISKETGIPMSKSGIERKIGNTILKMIFGK